MPVPWVRPIQFAHYAIGTHDGLVFDRMDPLVPRKVHPLFHGWSADGPCSAIYKAPAVTQRSSSVVHSLQ